MGSYVFLAILGMVAYSITTIFVKIAAREVRRGWLAALKGLDLCPLWVILRHQYGARGCLLLGQLQTSVESLRLPQSAPTVIRGAIQLNRR